jgi:tricorn protease
MNAAQPNATLPPYLRQPALHGDTLVFVSDDDLWRASVQGGPAQRLTAGLSEPATPCLSPCGEWLAFAGRDEQHSEVWLMPAAGGPARRLTYLGSDLAVRGWAPDGRIVFSSNHGQPFFRNWHSFLLPTTGGVPERVPVGQAQHLAWGPGGRRLIGRNTIDPARWKRYRGGTAGHLWVESAACDGQFRRMSELPGNLTSPMWLGGRVYFIGDGEGTGNLYSCLPEGGDLKRHTDHDGSDEAAASAASAFSPFSPFSPFYARHASTDGQRIVYQAGAELWLFDPASDSSRRIELQVPTGRAQAARKFVPAAEHLHGAQLHPAGHSLALEARGQLFTMALWEGAVRQHGGAMSGTGAAGRHRFGQWLADGHTLVAVGDASGEEEVLLFEAGSAAPRALPWTPAQLGRVTALKAAPVGTTLALANHRNELWLGDTATGSLRRLDHSAFERIEDLAWSPCGGWLAYTCATSARHKAIKLCECASGQTHLATQPEFRDYGAAFDPEGKYLYFLSLRTFDPVYDAVQFELSFPRAARPYLVALQAGGPVPFDPAPKGMKGDERRGMKERGDDLPGDATAQARPVFPAIDPDGLAQRVTAFPVAEGRFGQIAGAAGGRVLWTQLPLAGAHGRGGHKDSPGRLEVFDFATGEVKTLVEQADQFSLAADHHTLLVRHGPALRVLDASRGPDDKASSPPPGHSRKTGRIDLGRVRLSVEPPREWAQMLREVWRLQRDHFWTADMSGIDWDAVYARYAPLLARVATRGEFSDLVWELQGELGTSHAYESGGDHRKPPAVALGHLAAALQPVALPGGGTGWEITEIVRGDPWDAAADSPLRAVGVEARVGERIIAVGGQALSAALPPQALLVHHAGAKVALTLQSADGASMREVLVSALADETPARYRAWVEANRAWVHQASGGRVGYLHLPDMMSAGFAEFHRYFAAESDRDALVVDVRYNRGGHVSQLLLEKVARKRVAWNQMRWGQPAPYPDEAPAGAVVALTNEHAGSDGDIFSHNFKLMRIGTLVGQRTWGGVIGIWPRHTLIDGSQTTQPEYSFWFKDVGWAVENHGTDPDIEVANAPQDDAFNAPERDRQLAAALAEALAAADRQGVSKPDFGPRPQLAAPPLPPRG